MTENGSNATTIGASVAGSRARHAHTGVIALAAASCLSLLVLTTAPAANASPIQEHWQGVWETSGIHGKIKLRQDGNAVVGHYPRREGTIGGEADGKTLEGGYVCDGKGKFKIHLIAGGDGFEGWYKPKGEDKVDWSGDRA